MSTVDCSRYQGVLSVAVLQGWKNAGVTRVILKAGGGDSGRYQDSQWVTNSANVRAAGLILEAYWFNGTTDPAGDAAFVVSFVPAGVRIWADVESEGSMPHWSDDQADVFERAVIAAGHPSGTYMSSSVTFGSWPKCSSRPLWVAAYGGSSVPKVGNWRAPVLWQYTSSGHLPGYGGNLDLDQDQAGLSALDATPLTPPIEGFDMPQNWAIGATRATIGETFGHVWTDPNNFSYQTNMAAWGDPVAKSLTGDQLTTIIGEANARGAAYAAVGGPGVVVPAGATTDPAVIKQMIADAETAIIAHIPTKLAP
jgi:GH25 family lysozyme M1 (1,4-beta-N-acetylmuramidase)